MWSWYFGKWDGEEDPNQQSENIWDWYYSNWGDEKDPDYEEKVAYTSQFLSSDDEYPDLELDLLMMRINYALDKRNEKAFMDLSQQYRYYKNKE